MLPTQVTYPEFVPDQLLTSENLNQVFQYPEEQERLTRSNLIGIGIVCGLKVKISTDGTSITITKGCGVTSEGYLIAVDEETYTVYTEFKAVQDKLYSKFVSNDRQQLFPLDELKKAAVVGQTTSLSSAYLADKVILLFVELYQEGSKNCNPNSCDDKGIKITVNVRPLVVTKTDAASLTGGVTGINPVKVYQDLKELKLPRFDVKASSLVDSSAIFSAYKKVLNAAFLNKVQETLGNLYTTLSPVVVDLYPSNPFNSLADTYKFLSNSSITESQLINFQYYYDLFSDVLQAYEELRKAALGALNICCPDNLFPRHLLLGTVQNNPSLSVDEYRQYFIPSPILSGNSEVLDEIRLLFKRLVIMLNKFLVPVTTVTNFKKGNDTEIRITPSVLGPEPLSQKAIPFYYNVAEGIDPLYKNWSFDRYKWGKSSRTLSWHSASYSTDDDVLQPLLYDLEPFNFLRIEGHIGKPYTHVLKNILKLRNENRLPFNVVALSGDIRAIRNQLRDLDNLVSDEELQEHECDFQDLESLYQSYVAELICQLCKEMKYYYGLQSQSKNLPTPQSTVPQVPLLKDCSPEFRLKHLTLGQEFEMYYSSVKDQPFIEPKALLAPGLLFSNTAVNMQPFALLYYIEKLYETLSNSLSSFNYSIFRNRFDALIFVADSLKMKVSEGSTAPSLSDSMEDINDHLDVLIFNCREAFLETLYRDFLDRYLNVLMLKSFAYFTKKHPGVQHKAGVPMGGTFIVVYHEKVNEQVFAQVATNAEDLSAAISNTAGRRLAAYGDLKTKTSAKEEADSLRTLARNREAKSVTNGSRTNPAREYLQAIVGSGSRERGEYEQLLEDIESGTVIADFYLPYLCCSDCTPVNFIVREEPPHPAEPVSISMEEDDFCSEDEKPYAITVAPEGGEITGDGLSNDGSGRPVFIPKKVPLSPAEDKKEVVLTYSKDGQSATLTVTVFQQQRADFDFHATVAPQFIQFQNKSAFAESYSWDFGDGTSSKDENPSHQFKTEGTYAVTLKVTGAVCDVVSISKPVDIKLPRQKNCSSIAGSLAQFEKDHQRNTALASFLKEDPYPEIRNFVKKLESLLSKPAEEQLAFLESSEIARLFIGWLEYYNKLAVDSNYRELPLALYEVLVRMVLYFECISSTDADNSKLNLIEILKVIQGHLKALKAKASDLAPETQKYVLPILETLSTDFMKEEKQVNENNESATKPIYLKMIKSFISILNS